MGRFDLIGDHMGKVDLIEVIAGLTWAGLT